jgi:CheY-like chemotaxis protein
MPRTPTPKATAILVADDDAAVREFVSRALLRRGYDVTAVADGAQALEALDGAAFDLLISDIAMPELDGLALALEAAKRRPELPVVLMTGYADLRQRAEGAAAPIRGVVAKPFTLNRICAVTEEAIAERCDARPGR